MYPVMFLVTKQTDYLKRSFLTTILKTNLNFEEILEHKSVNHVHIYDSDLIITVDSVKDFFIIKRTLSFVNKKITTAEL